LNGIITVEVHPEKEVKVQIIKTSIGKTQSDAETGLANVDVAATQEGDTVTIRVRRLRQDATDAGADFKVTVPTGTVLELKADNGKITVQGSVGDVIAETGNGRIDVKGSKGKLKLSTKNGAIKTGGGVGTVDLHTDSGRIDVNSERAVVTARATNGSIAFAGRPGKGQNSLQTTTGRIAVTLSAGSPFKVDARTSAGTITTKGFELREPAERSKTRLKGTAGTNPAGTLKIETTTGNIDIERERPRAGG
jgi:DUF4097 and DUF4098 domain-containing protein YvlB